MIYVALLDNKVLFAHRDKELVYDFIDEHEYANIEKYINEHNMNIDDDAEFEEAAVYNELNNGVYTVELFSAKDIQDHDILYLPDGTPISCNDILQCFDRKECII